MFAFFKDILRKLTKNPNSSVVEVIIQPKNISEPITLNRRQSTVHELLLKKQTDALKLADWYLGALYALENPYNPDRFSQSAQSLRELLEKLPRVLSSEEFKNSVKPMTLIQKRQSIEKELKKFKKKNNGNWKGYEISSGMDKTLRKLEEYFEQNQQAKPRDLAFEAASKTDPMSSVLGKEATDKKQERFNIIWKDLQQYAHHKNEHPEKDIRTLMKRCEDIILEIFIPAKADDQLQINSLVTSKCPTEADMRNALLLMRKSGANYVYFWKHLNSTKWLSFLKDSGCFENPNWHPVYYLSRIANEKPIPVTHIIENLPNTDNQSIMRTIVEIAVNLKDINNSLRLYSKIRKYINGNDLNLALDPIIRILRRWSTESEKSRKKAIDLLHDILRFKTNPHNDVS